MYSFKELQEKIEEQIEEQNFIVPPENLFIPIKYILSIGGKRIRPVMTLMAANLFTKNVDDIVLSSLGIEIFHNFTLLHDDLMDNAPIRRSKTTVHEKWNSNTAILSGDAMLIKAYQYITNCKDKHIRSVLEIFSQTALDVCKGQQYDMEFEERENITEQEYLEMIRLKTAALLGCSLKMGALMADADHKNASILYRLGINLGIAFQLQDDMLDVYGDENIFGKKIGGDIVANKKTYLLIKAMELAKGDLKKQLQQQLREKNNRDEKITIVQNIYNKLEIKEKTTELIKNYINRSLEYLDKIEVEDDTKIEFYTLIKNLSNRTA